MNNPNFLSPLRPDPAPTAFYSLLPPDVQNRNQKVYWMLTIMSLSFIVLCIPNGIVHIVHIYAFWRSERKLRGSFVP